MLPFGVAISATVPQRSEIPEGLMNYPVLWKKLVISIISSNQLMHMFIKKQIKIT